MTRIGGYELLACPYCKQIHRKAYYSSINFQVSPNLFDGALEPKVCHSCGVKIQLSEMISIGHRELKRNVPNFLKLHKESNESILLKIKRFLFKNKIRSEESKSPDWMKYPIIR